MTLLALTASGCSVLNVPAYELRLPGSAWVVQEIDGQPLSPESTLVFEDDPNRGVLVRTPCREISLGYAMDSDGSWLQFEVPPGSPDDCTGESRRDHDRVIRALEGTTEWDVLDDEHIEFRGADRVRLMRVDGKLITDRD